MKINSDEDAKELIGQQVYIFSDNKLMPMVVNEVHLRKVFNAFGYVVSAIIKTAIGEFSDSDIYKDKDELIKYIDEVIDN